MKTNRWLAVPMISLVALGISGCASSQNPGGLSEREVGGLAGAGVGAGTGAIIGSATGHAAAGTAIGAPIGLVAGAAIGQGMHHTKETAKQEMREESMKQQYSESQPSLTSEQQAGVEAYKKYNARTGQRFPDYYLYDPVSGEKLDFVKAA